MISDFEAADTLFTRRLTSKIHQMKKQQSTIKYGRQAHERDGKRMEKMDMRSIEAIDPHGDLLITFSVSHAFAS